MARASWKDCSMSGDQTPSASDEDKSFLPPPLESLESLSSDPFRSGGGRGGGGATCPVGRGPAGGTADIHGDVILSAVDETTHPKEEKNIFQIPLINIWIHETDKICFIQISNIVCITVVSHGQ